MRLIRRLVGVIFGVAGLIGLVLCVAGIVGCWYVHSEIGRRVDRVFDRVDGSLVRAKEQLGQAEKRLGHTKIELGEILKREADLPSQPPAEKNARRLLSKKATSSFHPQIIEAREMLVKATEIGLVANGLLEAFGELPFVERANIDVGRLKEASDQLSELNERTSKLAILLAKAAPDDDAEIGRESTRAAAVLDRVATAVNEVSMRLEVTRTTIEGYRSRINLWIDRMAIAITLVLGWIGAGQLSLLLHGKKMTFAPGKSVRQPAEPGLAPVQA